VSQVTPGSYPVLLSWRMRSESGVCATNNVHYVKKEDFVIHDILTCMRTLTKLDDVHPERRLNAENYLKSPGGDGGFIPFLP